MRITSDEVAVIYARACVAWYGRRASKVIADRIREMKRNGDTSGVKAWSQVAAKLPPEGRPNRKHHLNGRLY
jgi:hypothetical protein